MLPLVLKHTIPWKCFRLCYLLFVALVLIGCIVSFSSKRNFSWSCLMLLVLSSFFPYNLKLHWAKNVHCLSVSYAEIEEICQILFLLPILTPLHLEIGKKSLTYFRLYYVHIFRSFALNVVIHWLLNFKLLICYTIIIIYLI